jgi:hypothetical protein
MAPPFRDGFEAGVILRGFIIGAVAEVNDHPLRRDLGSTSRLNEDQPGQGGEGDNGAKNI